MRLKISLFVCCFVLLSLGVQAQHVLQIETASPEEGETLSRYEFQQVYSSEEAARQGLRKLVESLHRDGYLLAHARFLKAEEDTSRILLLAGKLFSWAVLEPGNVEPAWLRQTSFREQSFRQRPFRQAEVAQLLQQLIEVAENNGYPFASVRLDALKFDSTALHAQLAMDKGPLILFDTLVVRGSARLSGRYLAAHLGIKPGEPYSQKTLEAVVGRLQQLPFARVESTPTVSFQNHQATVYVTLSQKRANRLDGILGLLPHPQEPGRFLFTGQFDMLLQNPFGTGKQMALQWQRFNPASQNLEAFYRHPYLLGTPISVELGFGLLKEAEAFVNREFKAAVQLKQSAYNILRLSLSHKDSRLLEGANTSEHAGFSLEQYGLGFSRSRLNDPFAPRRGYELRMDVSGGRKRLRSPGVGADSVTQQAAGVGMQYRASAAFRYFQPLAERLVLAHSLEGGLLSDKQLFINDLYRLGGLASLRGFREKNFFVSDFVLSRLELRYLAGSETYFFLFYDQAWMAQRAGTLHVSDWPLGFGAGLSLGTNSGTFNFVYGLGKSDTQPVGLSSSQVHFGYVNRF